MLLSGLLKHVIKQLQRVQNVTAGVLFRPSSVILHLANLANLHWLPIDLRIEFKILIVTYKTLHGLASAYVQDLSLKLPPDTGS